MKKKLNNNVKDSVSKINTMNNKERLNERILNFKAADDSSFGDAAQWQIIERNDRDLPFFK